ncbi:MarR family transcriptional regulator [Bacillus thuringiensis]|uniref:MarR family transcriptional regulator n=1 Tax=Bacillus thuringiensis TaxID=1428 RepID=A0AAW9GM42_BACTU|nr:MarR family transcriptional regulator [Bacillus thuringiensis]MDY0855557.1 MarR family transcriptional regulator [Bacillus thuringiensis]MDY4395357.1 MarR family transcriptional regulator [Bacillus thuringiensis]
MRKIVNFEHAEKKAKVRDSKIDSIYEKLEGSGGLSEEERVIMLQVLSKMSGGEEYFIGKKKKPTDRVRFVQIITDNINYLCKIGYLTNAEKAFLIDLIPYIEFKTNILVECSDEDSDEIDTDAATPSYLAKKLGKGRSNLSVLMNGLLEKGILAVAESGMTTDDGRICSSRTWFVNPNILCCSPKDGVDKATMKIFKKSLRNFKVDGDKKKHNLPIYLF